MAFDHPFYFLRHGELSVPVPAPAPVPVVSSLCLLSSLRLSRLLVLFLPPQLLLFLEPLLRELLFRLLAALDQLLFPLLLILFVLLNDFSNLLLLHLETVNRSVHQRKGSRDETGYDGQSGCCIHQCGQRKNKRCLWPR